MDALSRIHSSLRASGVLLDLHPQPENSRLEIWQGNRISPLGEIDQQQEIQEIEYAESRLAELEERGLYATDSQRFFDLLEHHPSVESWLQRWAEEGWQFAVDDEVLKSARELLQAGGGDLVIREPIRATRLNRRRETAPDNWSPN